MNYTEQIKKTQWQKKRLEIFERDNWKCTCCKSNEKQLQVHHLYYLPNTLIWEYDNEALKTVCKDCHEILTNELPKLSGIIAFQIISQNLDIFKI